MVAYLAEAYEDLCQEEGEPETRKNIRQGIERAGQYGITLERDVARYIDLMYAWSIELDTDPQTPWAGEILDQQDLDGSRKMDDLWEYSEMLLARDQQAETGEEE